LANGVFSVSLGRPQRLLRIPLVPGTASFGPSGTVSPLGSVSGTSFLSPDGTFFYANLTPVNSPTEREFVAGGLPVSASALASAPIVAFTVQRDAALQSNIPFIRTNAGGNLPNAYVSPLFIAPQTSPALQSSLAINGQDANQQSVLVTAIGNSATLQSSGAPMINGVVRGTSQLSATSPPVRIGSALSSVVDGNGNSLYGAKSISGFVLDQTQYNTTAPGSGVAATPVKPSTASEVALTGGSTNYGFTQPATAASVPAGVGTTRTSQTLAGYFGGVMNASPPAQPYTITGTTSLSTDVASNRVAASFTSDPLAPSATGGVSSVKMQFGPASSGFIDNNIYGAAESQTGPAPATVNGSKLAQAQLYLLSSGAAPPPISLLPSGAAYCQCQYLQWGYWGGDITTANAGLGNTPRIDRGNINFWTAGQITPAADINKLAGQGAVGNYAGHLIGSVFNSGAQYVAAGGLNATYNFGTRMGSLNVTNYDGNTFTVSNPMASGTGKYTFNFNNAITQQGRSITGAFNGGFYGPMAAETGGNFKFQTTAGPTYLTSGIFAAKR
jgi:trimeric autotransporter adhesin